LLVIIDDDQNFLPFRIHLCAPRQSMPLILAGSKPISRRLINFSAPIESRFLVI
jgi:hypothetical protein